VNPSTDTSERGRRCGAPRWRSDSSGGSGIGASGGVPIPALVCGRVLIQCLFALAFNLLFGITGLLSFGQAAYFGVGGYLAALTLVHGWTGILGVLLLSTVGAAWLAWCSAIAVCG